MSRPDIYSMMLDVTYQSCVYTVENVKLDAGTSNFNDLVNASVNQTLARSINTTLTATLPLIAIFLFGGATLRFFSLALIIGFLSGAYSSIFNASILLAWWRGRNASTLSKLEANQFKEKLPLGSFFIYREMCLYP